MFSPQAKAVWGKTDSKSGSWLPLHQHLVDALAWLRVLWQRWLPLQHHRIDYPSTLALQVSRVWVCLLQQAHLDLGKCAPARSSPKQSARPGSTSWHRA